MIFQASSDHSTQILCDYGKLPINVAKCNLG